jgi:O-antigen/teichoic acid export membrane protein
MLIRIYANVNVSIYRAFQRMEYELFVLIVDRSVGLIGILLVIYLRLDLVAVFLVFLASAIVRGIVSFYITLVKFVSPRFQTDLALWRRLMAASMPIGISLGIQRIYERAGTVILEGTRSIAEVGLFGGSLRIYTMTGLGASSLLGALFPVFSELAVSSGEGLVKAYQATLKFLLLFSLAICGVMLFGADFITAIILGPEFAQTSVALRILAPAVVFSFLGYLASFVLRSADHEAKDTANWGLSLATNLLLNLVLTVRYGFVGAAYALLISEAVLGILGLTMVTRYVSPLPRWEVFLGPLACGLVSAAIMVPLQRFTFPVSFLVGAIVYLTSIYAFGILSGKEKKLIENVARSVVPWWRNPR